MTGEDLSVVAARLKDELAWDQPDLATARQLADEIVERLDRAQHTLVEMMRP